MAWVSCTREARQVVHTPIPVGFRVSRDQTTHHFRFPLDLRLTAQTPGEARGACASREGDAVHYEHFPRVYFDQQLAAARLHRHRVEIWLLMYEIRASEIEFTNFLKRANCVSLSDV